LSSAVLIPLKLHWNCLLDLEPFGSQWSPLWRKSWNVFIKNLHFFSTDKRKTWTSWMTWGWVNYQQMYYSAPQQLPMAAFIYYLFITLLLLIYY